MRIKRILPAMLAAAAAAAAAGVAPAAAQTIERAADTAVLPTPLPQATVGRIAPQAGAAPGTALMRQWPGTYFETAFQGTEAGFRVGRGDMHLRVRIDDGAPVSLVKPAPGLYRIAGLAPGRHTVRIDVANESQGAPTTFGGFYAGSATTAVPLAARPRQIEFIGDSHTVGYGNTSASRTCTPDELWRTTDTAQGIAPRVARRFGADYQVNAISGRGVVRNYGGGPGALVPDAYPFVLFDGATRYDGQGWSPDVIVIALGTNDFSTPLGQAEKWKTRAALQADYEARYVAFVKMLRARNPQARFVLWATDLSEGEIARETQKVADRLRADGETKIDFVPVSGLQMGGCDWHPNLADDETIAGLISARLNAAPDVWPTAGASPATNAAPTVPAPTVPAPPVTAAPAANPPASRRAGLDSKLINNPVAVWNVYGARSMKALPDGGPSGYPAMQVVVQKGANVWDAGASVPMVKPVAEGHAVLMAVYLRAPRLADGAATPVTISLNQGAAPYEGLANASVAVTNAWKVYYAAAWTGRAWTAAELVAGLNLAGANHQLELGPVQVFDLGTDVDLATLPKN